MRRTEAPSLVDARRPDLTSRSSIFSGPAVEAMSVNG
jgi:hypothetical protein